MKANLIKDLGLKLDPKKNKYTKYGLYKCVECGKEFEAIQYKMRNSNGLCKECKLKHKQETKKPEPVKVNKPKKKSKNKLTYKTYINYDPKKKHYRVIFKDLKKNSLTILGKYKSSSEAKRELNKYIKENNL